MSVAQPTESPFDHDRYFTFTVTDETYNGSIHFLTHYSEKPDFVEVLRNAFFRDETYGDNRADWHRNTTSFYAWVKAHMLRLAWDCREGSSATSSIRSPTSAATSDSRLRRLVDLLVKLAIDGENATYAPRVDANRFLTVAKKYYGLDPPG